MKNVLVLYYSQSGQLEEIAKNITAPLRDANDISVTFCAITMEKPFPFPWDKASFFDVFPESFLQIPANIQPPSATIFSKKYDLVILAYQVWYLSPSIPINSFLKSHFATQLFKNTPVITVIGCRNMWVMAQEKVKKCLTSLEAKHVGNIVLVDRHINHVSVITIVNWMFTGKKEKYLGLFPKPGVSDADIADASKFGKVILQHLQSGTYTTLQEELLVEKAVQIRPFLIEMDKKANKMFRIWAGTIIKKTTTRQLWLKAFYFYLWAAIWLMAPIVYILHLFTYFLKFNTYKKEKSYYQGVISSIE